MEHFGILKESYYWNKYIDEAQRNTIEQPSKKDTKKPSSNQPNKTLIDFVYDMYTHYGAQIYPYPSADDSVQPRCINSYTTYGICDDGSGTCSFGATPDECNNGNCTKCVEYKNQ